MLFPCLTIFGPTHKLTLNPSTAMHFLIQSFEWSSDISHMERGKFLLDCLCLIACFSISPKITFITTQLRSSVWQSLSRSFHILSTYDNLRSKNITYMMCKEIIRTSHFGSVQPHVIHVPTLLVRHLYVYVYADDLIFMCVLTRTPIRDNFRITIQVKEFHKQFT
jgi:hypothetical protein